MSRAFASVILPLGTAPIGGQIRADFFKSLRESAKSAVRALFADFFRRFADFLQTLFDWLTTFMQTFCRLYVQVITSEQTLCILIPYLADYLQT